jgi:hypothetical protein
MVTVKLLFWMPKGENKMMKWYVPFESFIKIQKMKSDWDGKSDSFNMYLKLPEDARLIWVYVNEHGLVTVKNYCAKAIALSEEEAKKVWEEK